MGPMSKLSLPNSSIYKYNGWNTVKPVYNNHLGTIEIVVVADSWPLYTFSRLCIQILRHLTTSGLGLVLTKVGGS